jgi:type III secretion system FlhB-like substrate exporter
MTQMTDQIVGLNYEFEGAPAVILKGAGQEAQAILERAQQLGDIPIVKDPALVRQLYRLPIDSPIGRELFPVMAALLAHVLRADAVRVRESQEAGRR